VLSAVSLSADQNILTALSAERSITDGRFSKKQARQLTPKTANNILPSGRSLLTHAIAQHRPIAVKLLLDAGADPNMPDKRGVLPLEETITQQNTPLFKYLILNGAQLTPLIVAQATGYDPHADYIYHAVRNIQIGSCLDGHNCINNLTAQEAQLLLSSLATHADTILELKRATVYGADVNFQDADGSTIVQTAVRVCKPELIRFAATQGLKQSYLGSYESYLHDCSTWLQGEMRGREDALERLTTSIKIGNFDYALWDDAFRGPYGLSILRLIPPSRTQDLLEIAAASGMCHVVCLLIKHGARTRHRARIIAEQYGVKAIC
jgi:hypothetical protein